MKNLKIWPYVAMDKTLIKTRAPVGANKLKMQSWSNAVSQNVFNTPMLLRMELCIVMLAIVQLELESGGRGSLLLRQN